jgi:hypothetical protein
MWATSVGTWLSSCSKDVATTFQVKNKTKQNKTKQNKQNLSIVLNCDFLAKNAI